MLMNAVEKAMMNNPVRAALQRRFEMPLLMEMGGRMQGGRALEVGCGRGVGTELILEMSGAGRVDAFDLDPDMVARASQRLRGHGERVRLSVGDVERIEAEDGAYDAVFDFGIVHHVPDWRSALREINRVLKPGGRFYVEEVLAKFILDPLWRRVLVHPLHDRFDHDGFRDGLKQTGFQVVASRQMWGQFAWFVADKTSRRDTPEPIDVTATGAVS
ncbi:MAG: methyltransferase domain-containing protein [Hyphomonadaceae bacterium JAD_PAG50586_4]|nr:MAG: methyltransferase domain-containing protein [Hyphomonadaceae bacterium JAD_PAG50586_4]